MDEQKVDMFIMTMGAKFPSDKMMFLKERLSTMDDRRFVLVQSLSYKEPIVSLVLSILVGYLGIDRFYVGDIGMGILKLLTAGGCGIITIVDWFLIMNRAKEKNFQTLMLNV